MVGSSHAILSATSSRFIIGQAPQVVVLSGADKHGFTVNGIFYSEASDNIKSSEVKEFDGNLSVNDFKIETYTVMNLDRAENYRDIDGDNADPDQPFKVEKTDYWWYDNSGRRIIGADRRKAIGCGSGFSMPLKLIIQTKVKAYSKYGIPNESDQVTLAKTYQIAPRSQICYAKPNDVIISPNQQWRTYDPNLASNPVSGPWAWNGANISRHPDSGGGYSADYVPNWGFKANPIASGKKFPTTGFPGAKFQLVMTGAQDDYRYQVINNPGGGVSIDQNGVVKLNSKPLRNVTVRATLKRDTSVIHDYIFNPTSVWLEPHKNENIKLSTAINLCGGVNNIPLRKDYTNSPAINVAENGNWSIYPNSFTRSIGDSIMGEWGWVSGKNYPESNWPTENTYYVLYWTREINYAQYNIYFTVNLSGYVSVREAERGESGKIACKH
ncbi:hypothetical protein [Gilliamella sp. Pas-s25]|uniref:hypothetical protein n=1 Tax=Gilliamella sp. Pas-s25 TaxID=2687310 RepID=UPI00135E7780|nr:hypothetical protein [Gilliamella sp. Pas-s25]MWP63036.1 hypothetical protein [Gilliamella sp. Pas-s25]